MRAVRLPMASDVPAGGSTGPYRPAGRWWPAPAGPDGAPPVLDVAFDAGALPGLRAAVRARALGAGFGESRAEDVVLAVHELAANSVRHGGGAGRLREWNVARSLECRVDDGELRGTAGSGGGHAGPGSDSGRMPVNSLPCVPGHGLWVVQQVADQMRSMSGSHGTSIVATFGPHD
jgi:anti-sigma regulatory factor (Ser/Thr protein kinase)